ncbi:transcriptional regulator, MerR family [Magnetococcus marinus MC-1]|uniref:Transcriptional regulator, MerR family n=1 Tax=Magnetococcus marinus (strain ATCC BAA-1437 / JCM 17883 / MC-1) TaxID=156889 RepID=A0LDY4_MAGMM|nr:MerR family transcriptional regulator [Magnetococcus marinus]ABK46177.1 transcriptional regulator, MerR family [Magnetococcus marinus MC-1]
MVKGQTLSANFPIRFIAQVLNVNVDTVRTWERRYGLFEPVRNRAGQRRYLAKDLELAQRLRLLLDNGMRISGAIAEVTSHSPPLNKEDSHDLLKMMLQAISAFNLTHLEDLTQHALNTFQPDTVMYKLILPVFKNLGSRWDKHPTGIAEEHFASHFFHNKLTTRLNHILYRKPRYDLLTVCVPGEQHELGLLLFCLTLAEEGIYPLYLGTSLPFDQFKPVVQSCRCRGILLAGKAKVTDNPLLEPLTDLSRAFDIPIFLGGKMADHSESYLRTIGILPLPQSFKQAVAEI